MEATLTPREMIAQAQRLCGHEWRHFGYETVTEPSEYPNIITYILKEKLYSCSVCGAQKQGDKIIIMLPS